MPNAYIAFCNKVRATPSWKLTHAQLPVPEQGRRLGAMWKLKENVYRSAQSDDDEGTTPLNVRRERLLKKKAAPAKALAGPSTSGSPKKTLAAVPSGSPKKAPAGSSVLAKKVPARVAQALKTIEIKAHLPSKERLSDPSEVARFVIEFTTPRGTQFYELMPMDRQPHLLEKGGSRNQLAPGDIILQQRLISDLSSENLLVFLSSDKRFVRTPPPRSVKESPPPDWLRDVGVLSFPRTKVRVSAADLRLVIDLNRVNRPWTAYEEWVRRKILKVRMTKEDIKATKVEADMTYGTKDVMDLWNQLSDVHFEISGFGASGSGVGLYMQARRHSATYAYLGELDETKVRIANKYVIDDALLTPDEKYAKEKEYRRQAMQHTFGP